MKKINIDGYELYEEDGVLTNAIFKDPEGQEVNIALSEKLQEEFKNRRKEQFREEWEKRKHIDAYLKDDYLLEIRTSDSNYSMEDEVISEDFTNTVIQEIWKLPSPQNRRVFMSIINNYSYAKISRIEGVSDTAIRTSVEIGKRKLQEKLKKFLK